MHNKEKTGDVSPDGESTLTIDGWSTKTWRNSKNHLHRRDGPAAEWLDGAKLWYVNGKKHRLDGPAVEYANGSKVWYVNGGKHRLDGPAIEWPDGSKAWYIDNIHYNYEDWKKEVEHRKNLDTIYSKGSEVDLNLKGL